MERISRCRSHLGQLKPLEGVSGRVLEHRYSGEARVSLLEELEYLPTISDAMLDVPVTLAPGRARD